MFLKHICIYIHIFIFHMCFKSTYQFGCLARLGAYNKKGVSKLAKLIVYVGVLIRTIQDASSVNDIHVNVKANHMSERVTITKESVSP